MEVCLQGLMNLISNNKAMLKLAKLIFLLFFGLAANTQTHHFVYIENLAKKPFNIKLDNKVFESDGKNFITIPKLENGTYNLSISTDGSKDNKFSIDVDGSDLGFTLKQNSDGYLVLFDMNRFTTTEQIKKKEPQKPIVKQEPVVKQADIEAPKSIAKIQPINTIIEAAKENKIDSAPIKLVATKPIIEKKITKLYEKENKDGLNQIYIDATSGKADTISILIPYAKTIFAVDTIKQAKAEPVVEQTMESKNIDAVAPVILVNNCPSKASESDVANFSSQIQATLTLKNKLKLANTVLKEKCFTVNQVKRLGVLFLNESGKFNFYKLAQTAVSDSKNFALLEKELLDVKLKEEFKALSNPQ
jgi:galactitol-specific phosphotransferase system IIB component